MRVLVCGSRDYTNEARIFEVLDEAHAYANITCIIEGEQRGADKIARKWAESRGVPFEPYPAKWTEHGKAAGPIRNQKMLDEGKPDIVYAFPKSGAENKGTGRMIEQAIRANVPNRLFPE